MQIHGHQLHRLSMDSEGWGENLGREVTGGGHLQSGQAIPAAETKRLHQPHHRNPSKRKNRVLTTSMALPLVPAPSRKLWHGRRKPANPEQSTAVSDPGTEWRQCRMG
jgi:hypothetical protein